MTNFPTLGQLASLTEADYWALGWGYRAPRMTKLMQQLTVERAGAAWLAATEAIPSYPDARAALMPLCGVGRKVADCICLFGLSFFHAIPVDTHIWQFAQRYHYLKSSAKTLNEKAHDMIGDRLRAIFGTTAGFALMTLFVAEVHPFRLLAAHLPKTYQARPAECRAELPGDPGAVKRKIEF